VFPLDILFFHFSFLSSFPCLFFSPWESSLFLEVVFGSLQNSNRLYHVVIIVAIVCTFFHRSSLCAHSCRSLMKWKSLSSYDTSLISNMSPVKSLM
jgi:hypothetical protein